ncbi:MAG: glycosyltransferase family 2 protein [Acidimicrobiia bacterium]
MSGGAIEYSFVIPILNERETLAELYERLEPVMAALDGPSEVVLVDDGSSDASYELMCDLHARDRRIRALRLSRNFGHQTALSAGLDHARGRAVVIMDGDLQDPPEVVLEMARRWREGYDVVYAVRDERAGESWTKLTTATWFYRIFGRLTEIDMPPNAGDFRLVDRRAVDAVTSMPERRRYLRGMFAWVGYNQTGVHYSRAPRHAGRTKFPLRKMISFAADGIVSFSTAPLRLTLGIGFVVSILSLLAGVAAIVLKLAGVEVVPGWASIAVGMAFLSGIQLTVLGLIGSYIARIHDEVKQRPLYLVADCVGLDSADRSFDWRDDRLRRVR